MLVLAAYIAKNFSVHGIPVEAHLVKNSKEFLAREGMRVQKAAKRRNRRSVRCDADYHAEEDKRKKEARMSRIRQVSHHQFVTRMYTSLIMISFV